MEITDTAETTGAVHHTTAAFLAGLDPAERVAAELLAQARQRIAEPGCPPWAELTPDEQAGSTVAALHWLRAARSLVPAPTKGQHQFHFAVTVQGGGCDWTSEPFRLTVRANSLTEACTKAVEVRLPGWTHPEDVAGAEPPAPAVSDRRDDCYHDIDELDDDEHLANCLYDPAAARRLAQREGQWDAVGLSGYEL